MIRPVRKYPDPILKAKSREVVPSEFINQHTKAWLDGVVDDMIETMYWERGAGLAAIQIGVDIRLVVLDVSAKGPEVFFNPVIVEKLGMAVSRAEGCLSLPGLNETVPRHPAVVVRYQTRDGSERVLDTRTYDAPEKARLILAQGLQHEVEHLDGILMLDKLSNKERERAKRIIRQARK